MLRGHESRPHCHDTVLRYAVTLQVWTHPQASFCCDITAVRRPGRCYYGESRNSPNFMEQGFFTLLTRYCHLFLSGNRWTINLLNPELNPICYLLALLAQHFLHVSRIRVKSLTLRLLMSYIHMERLFLMFLDHTQDAAQSVGLLWTSDQLVAGTST